MDRKSGISSNEPYPAQVTDMLRKGIQFAIILLWALPIFVSAQNLSGKVLRISDGDTFILLDSNNTQVRVRLHGVDAPESNQAFGTEAKEYLSGMIDLKQVTVNVMDIDQYGRTVGVVSVAGLNCNQEMVRAGFAWWYKFYAPKDTVLERMEAEARSTKVGLWADAHPIAPWDFRRGVSVSTAKAGTQAGAASTQSQLKQECCKVRMQGKGSSDSCFPRNRICQKVVMCDCEE